MKKSNLDEMQEQKMLGIEKNGFWLAFWGLIISIAVQAALMRSPEAIIGEMLVLMVVSAHLVIGCLRNGIWDRKLEPNWVTNLLASLVTGVYIALFVYFMGSSRVDDRELLALLVTIFFVATFALCFVVLTICGNIYKKRREKLDSEKRE